VGSGLAAERVRRECHGPEDTRDGGAADICCRGLRERPSEARSREVLSSLIELSGMSRREVERRLLEEGAGAQDLMRRGDRGSPTPGGRTCLGRC
jgi:hypothetical protein